MHASVVWFQFRELQTPVTQNWCESTLGWNLNALDTRWFRFLSVMKYCVKETYDTKKSINLILPRCGGLNFKPVRNRPVTRPSFSLRFRIFSVRTPSLFHTKTVRFRTVFIMHRCRANGALRLGQWSLGDTEFNLDNLQHLWDLLKT